MSTTTLQQREALRRKTQIGQLASDVEVVLERYTERLQVLEARYDRLQAAHQALRTLVGSTIRCCDARWVEAQQALLDEHNEASAARLRDTQVLRRTTLKGRLRWVLLGY